MPIQASSYPGAFERQYFRQVNYTALFKQVHLDEDTWYEAKAKDQTLLAPFMEQLQCVLERAVALKSNESSDVLLAVKAELDRLYTASCCLPEDQSQIQQSLAHLIETIMESVRKGAGEDTLALQELDEEAKARRLHFDLLKTALVADLLSDDVVIHETDLVPTLLSADKADLAQVVQLFDAEQTEQFISQAQAFLSNQVQGFDEAQQNLHFIQGYLVFLQQG